MIHAHSLGRAARYYARTDGACFRRRRARLFESYTIVLRALLRRFSRHGFKAGDRLAILLPNEPDYIELVYACAWLGVIAVPLNTRLSVNEIDHILADANPRGLIRHSSLPVPTVQFPWQLVLDQEPLDVQSDSGPDAIYDPEAILALIYTSGTTGQSQRCRADARKYPGERPPPQLLDAAIEEGAVHLHAAPIFHITDFPFMFAAPAFGTCQVTVPKFSPQSFCETVQRERVSSHCVGADDDQFADPVPGTQEL